MLLIGLDWALPVPEAGGQWPFPISLLKPKRGQGRLTRGEAYSLIECVFSHRLEDVCDVRFEAVIHRSTSKGKNRLPSSILRRPCNASSKQGKRVAGVRSRILVGCLFAAISLCPLADTRIGRTALERYHAEQARELKREQRQFFEGVEKALPRLEERQLKRRLEQQITRQRQLQDQQIREQAALQQRLRVLPDEKVRRLEAQQLKRFRLEQERQLFRFRVEQRSWLRGH